MPVEHYVTLKNLKSKSKNPKVLRKAVDTDFRYDCEWCDCTHESTSMNEFNHHVGQHRRAYTQHLGPEAERGEEEFIFYCQWRDCHSQIEGKVEEFARHVYYHTFHQYLKFLGRHVQEVDGMEPCALGSLSRNMIPELPEKLMCRWQDCNMVYDNPYIFYSHVAHHCQDIPKDKKSKEPFRCRWEGCKAVLKSWYKIREHMRSHTQAKVIACPTCGSLFANNTRFIDHLMRQLQTGPSFVCSNCGARFASERLLRDHMRRHVNHYKCPLCDMTCPSPSAVRDHVRYRHSAERSFQCSACDYKAKTAADLRIHLLTGVHESRTAGSERKANEENEDEDLIEEEDEEEEEEGEDEEEESSSGEGRKQTRPMEAENEKACVRHNKQRHTLQTRKRREPVFQCHVCRTLFRRGNYLTTHLTETHSYSWPSGHRRFRYKLHDDGFWRLQTVRLESMEVSEELLGQKMASHRGSDDDDDEEGDSDAGHRLTIDESSKAAAEREKGRPVSRRNLKANSRSKDPQRPTKTRHAHNEDLADSELPSSNSEVGGRRNPKSHKDTSNMVDRSRDKTEPARVSSSEAIPEDGQEGRVEVSRKNPSRNCKRKRRASGGEGCNDHSKDATTTSDSERPAKRGRSVLQDSSPGYSIRTRSSPRKAGSMKANARSNSLISLAAAAAGLDMSEDPTEGETPTQGEHFSMPSMEDLSSVLAVSNSGVESGSHTESHALSSGTGTCGKLELPVEQQSTGVQTRNRKSKSLSVTPVEKKAVSGRPARKSRAMPSRFSPRCSGQREVPALSSTSPVLNRSPPTSSSPKATRARGGKRERIRADRSPAAASTLSSSSARIPLSVDGGESVVDEGDASSAGATPYYGTDTASAGATPHYGTDTDFSEYNPDSPGSSTSVYAINPQYIMQLRQRLQQQQQQNSQPSGDVSGSETLAERSPSLLEASVPANQQEALPSRSGQDLDALSSCRTNRLLTCAESADLVTSSAVGAPTAAAPHAQHREDTNDSWFALLTQAELCREEQQRKQQLSGSPDRYAEVIVGSGSQLSTIGDVDTGASHGPKGPQDSVQQFRQQVSGENPLQQHDHPHQLQEMQPYSAIIATSTTFTPASTAATVNSMSPQKATTSPQSPPKAMFPSPEKSFFTIGWALGAGVSPIKQEWNLMAPSEDCPGTSTTSVGVDRSRDMNIVKVKAEVKSEDAAAQGCDGHIADSSNNNGKSIVTAESNAALSSIVNCKPDLGNDDVDSDQLETVQAVGSIVNTSTTAFSEVAPSTVLPSSTIGNEGSMLVFDDTGVVMCGDATDAGAPQELYQIVEGPNGEYQMVSLTTADLYSLVDSDGRSVVFSQPPTGADVCADQPADDKSSVITVDESGAWAVARVEAAQGGSSVQISDPSTQRSGQDSTSEELTPPGCVSLQRHCVYSSGETSGQHAAQTKATTTSNIADISAEDKCTPELLPVGVAHIGLPEDADGRTAGRIDVVGRDPLRRVDDKTAGSFSEQTTTPGDLCRTFNPVELGAGKAGISCAVSEAALLLSKSLSHEVVVLRPVQDQIKTENSGDQGEDSDGVDRDVGSHGTCGRTDNDVDDDQKEDGSGLYNLQMLGEVALSGEVPTPVSQEDTMP